MKLVIITGITGKLGKVYLEYFQKDKSVQCVAFSRREINNANKKTIYLLTNLLDKEKIKRELKKLNFKKYSSILFIHPIGMFKFEYLKVPEIDQNKDGIDDEIFESNVLTFTNLFDLIKEKMRKENNKISLIVCAFGSITDKYKIPYWNSYTKSKDFLRSIIKKTIFSNKSLKIKGIFINVSTTDTGNERNLRPKGNRKYWLKPKEIVKFSLEIINKNKESWMEMNIYKHNPNFDVSWYTNHENVLERWKKQMRGKNK